MAISRFNIDDILAPLAAGHTILVPNHRAMDAILNAWGDYQSRTQQVWNKPEVYAIDIWIQNVWEEFAYLGSVDKRVQKKDKHHPCQSRLLNSNEESLLWQQVLSNCSDEFPMLYTTDTINAANRAYQLSKQWRLSLTALRDYQGISDVAAFIRWQEEFTVLCEQAQAISLTDAVAWLANNINNDSNDSNDSSTGQRAVLLPTHVSLLNFLQPPPLYQQLFSELALASTVEAISCPAKKSCANNDIKALQTTTGFCFADLENEVGGAAQWALNTAKLDATCHIGIVCDDVKAAEPLLERYLRKQTGNPIDCSPLSRQFNMFSGTVPLTESPFLKLAIDILALNCSEISTSNFCTLLRSPFFACHEAELHSRIRLENQLRSRFETTTNLAAIRRVMLDENGGCFCPFLAQALLQFDELRRHAIPTEQGITKTTTAIWLGLFEKQLERIGWHDKPSQANTANNDTGTDYQRYLLQEWRKLCQQFQRLNGLSGQLDVRQALQILSSLGTSMPLHSPFRISRNISLLTPEQAMDFSFSHLWILSMDDQKWPAKASPANFIPYALQRELAMPASCADVQLSSSKSILQRLQEVCNTAIHYSFHLQAEDQELRPTPLLRFEDTPAIVDTNNGGDSQHQRQHTPPLLETVSDPLAIGLNQEEHVIGGANLLNQQALCPFRGFASHRLKLRKQAQFNTNLSAADRGTALHLALNNFWQHTQNLSQLKSLIIEQTDFTAQLRQSADIAIAWLHKRYPRTMTPGFSQLEHERIVQLLITHTTVDAQRSDFTVLERESQYNWSHKNIQLSLKVDRVDRLADGSLLIIDYKTGKKAHYRWMDGPFAERPEDLQLPLYLVCVNASHNNVATASLIAQINKDNVGYLGASGLDNIRNQLESQLPFKKINYYSENWNELLNNWQLTIQHIANEFANGLCKVAPVFAKESCQHCDFPSFCRIGTLDSSDTALPVEWDNS